MKNLLAKKILLSALLFLFCLPTLAAQSKTITSKPVYTSLVGTWITMDDQTKKTRAVVKIWESDDALYGKILRVFPRPGDTGRCVKCPGKYRNKPIEGLNFLWDAKKLKHNVWGKGKILDPANGKVYRCRLTLIDKGMRLKVRGYVGMILLGRTEIWHRKTATVKAKKQKTSN